MRRRVRASLRAGLIMVCGSTLAATLACDTQSSEPIAGAASEIIGGKLDTTHKGVVALLKRVPTSQGSGYYPSCTGTLLTQNLVLTAQHCIADLTSRNGSVDCGVTRFKPPLAPANFRISIEANVGREGLTPYKVAQVWVPDAGTDVCGADIALMMLEGTGIPSTAAATIEPRLDSPVPTNDVFAAIGYGLQDPDDQLGETAGQRMAVLDATVYCQGAECQTSLVKDVEFVAESPVCSGDSGGPAIDSDGRVCGVTSRGDEQCTIAIYSSVEAWRSFIIEKTFVAAKSGGYTPPPWAGTPPPDGTGGGGSSGGSGSGGSGGASAGGGETPTNGGSSGSGSGRAGSDSGTGTDTGPDTPPTIDPLGTECKSSSQCLGSYKCWSASGTPPGICVPACSASKTSCPGGYTCDASLNACTKPAPAEANDDGGCSVGGARAPGSAGALWLGLSLVALSVARRHRGAHRSESALGRARSR